MITRIKICGLTREEDIQTALQLDVHALGFVCYPNSPRFVNAQRASELVALVPPFVSTVGLFVNATEDQVIDFLGAVSFHLLQFHGDETPEQCHRLAEAVKRPFIRAMRIKDGMCPDDLLQYEAQYQASSPWYKALLLDAHVDSFGGAGKVFDWSIIPKELGPRVVLSGGLSSQNIAGAISQVHPWAVDVSSGVERAKGIKDPIKLRAFVDAVTKLTDKADRRTNER